MAIGRLLVGKGGSMRTPVIQIKGDGNTQVIELIVQRYYGGIDLAPLTWSVTAENAKGATDEYDVSNVQIKDDVITMLWTLYGTVTAAAGIARFKLTGYSNADDKVLVWQSGTYCIGVIDTIEYEPGSEVGQELSNVHKLIAYVDQELNGVVQAGKDAAEAAERANVAADRVDSRVTALEKFTFDPEPYAHTGDIVQFDNYENMPMNVVTHIEPVQSGSGDPYPGGGGKNLQPNDATTKTQNGVTFTGNHDGTVIANGTATSDIYYNLPTPHVTVGETYILTGCPAGGGSNTYRLYHKYRDSGGNYADDYGNGVTFTEENGTYVTTIFIASGQTVSNLVFKPMIRIATDADATYAPYSNIRPITGHTGDVLTRCGKNLVDMSSHVAATTTAAVEHNKNSMRVYTLTDSTYCGTKGDLGFVLRAGVVYTLSATVTEIVSGTVRVGFRRYRADANGAANTFIANTSIIFDSPGYKKITFSTTVDETVYLSALVTWSTAEAGDATFADIQLELGSAPTEYEPYNSETTTADFDQTVYGGTYDWNTGVLTVEWSNVRMADQNWTPSTNAAGRYFVQTLGAYARGIAPMCNIMPGLGSLSLNARYTLMINGNSQLVVNTDFTTVDQFVAWLDENDAYMCYKLAEPITIQLTPQDILALGGVNTLYAEAGDITVSGRKDILYLTDYLLNKLKSIEETN